MRYFSAIVFSAVGTLAVGFHVVVAPSIVESLKCCHSSIKYSASSILPVLPVRHQYQYLWVRPSTSQSSTPCPKYFTVLYYTVLYCTVLCCTVLYCTALHCTSIYRTTRRTQSSKRKRSISVFHALAVYFLHGVGMRIPDRDGSWLLLQCVE